MPIGISVSGRSAELGHTGAERNGVALSERFEMTTFHLLVPGLGVTWGFRISALLPLPCAFFLLRVGTLLPGPRVFSSPTSLCLWVHLPQDWRRRGKLQQGG